jgi:phage replication O-like protein O
MANPQIENGYTKIANEILENIAKVKLSPTQNSIIYIIWRHTYGFSRKEHNISLTFLASATICDLRNIQRELKKLISRKIINSEAKGNIRILSFNKNYNQWLGDGETDNGETANITNGETANITNGETANQERNKEKLKENSASILINDFFEQLWKLYPNKKGKPAVSMKSKQAICKIGYDKMVQAIENYKIDLKNNPWKQAMNGSTFFNGRYEDYFETDPQQEPEPVSMYPDL